MKYKVLDNYKKRLLKYLKTNNLKTSDIKDYKIEVYNKKLCVNVIFKDSRSVHFPLFKYHLNKKGIGTLALTCVLATSIMVPTIAKAKFKTDDTLPEPEPTITEITYGSDIEEIQNQNNATNKEKNLDGLEHEVDEALKEYDNENLVEEDSAIDLENNNKIVSREIHIEGANSPDIINYNHMIENYSEYISLYAHRYGVDPSMVAALIMEETGADDTEERQLAKDVGFGLGSFTVRYYNNVNFHVYNYDTNEYEDYLCVIDNLRFHKDLQIKVICMQLAENLKKYQGNMNAALAAYNHGPGAIDNILKNKMKKNDYMTLEDYTKNDDLNFLINDSNLYSNGDNQYLNKVYTYLSNVLNDEVFGSSTVTNILDDGTTYKYNVTMDRENLRGVR